MSTPDPTGPLLAIDAPFVLFRSFFALPQTILGVDGHPIGALLGATNLTLRIAAELEPRAIVLCFGADAAAYRVELYEPYHAQRPEVPEALAWQFEQAPDYFASFGWTTENTDTLEADDLLHSLAKVEVGSGGRALIMTGDRDMYQCAGEGVTVLFLKMGGRGYEAVDPDEVERRYGVPPGLVPDFIALRGDPSDGLPGAPGIGPKTASSLLKRYGSLEAAIAGADAESPRIAASLRETAPELLRFRDIATLRDADVERPPDRSTDLREGALAARRLGMGKLSERLEQAKTLSDL
jgi:DNA polymerase-1